MVKGIVAEDFVNYKVPSMFISTVQCDWKCCNGDPALCQNSVLLNTPNTEIKDIDIYHAFKQNDISKAVVIGGLEPFMQFDELVDLIDLFRSSGETCDFVIYTGYYPNEVSDEISVLLSYKGIIIKFGRYMPDRQPIFDDVLGVTLASDNQFAVRIT